MVKPEALLAGLGYKENQNVMPRERLHGRGAPGCKAHHIEMAIVKRSRDADSEEDGSNTDQ